MPLLTLIAIWQSVIKTNYKEGVMAWELLLTSDIGLLSLFTIVFILGMGWYLVGYAKKHMKDEAAKDAGAARRTAH